jgi:hypothetical protein
MSIQLRQSDIIAIVVSVTVALILIGLMIRSTRKTLREHARHSAEREYKENDKDLLRIPIIGGSKSKTMSGIYFLFVGVLIGYILSDFR